MSVVVGLARNELKKYNLVGWLPTFVSDAGSNVRRALAGRITKDKFREGDNMADWAPETQRGIREVSLQHILGNKVSV